MISNYKNLGTLLSKKEMQVIKGGSTPPPMNKVYCYNQWGNATMCLYSSEDPKAKCDLPGEELTCAIIGTCTSHTGITCW